MLPPRFPADFPELRTSLCLERVIEMCIRDSVHGVYVKGDMDCDDNYFDLLPGETKTVTVKKAAGKQLEVGSVR